MSIIFATNCIHYGFDSDFKIVPKVYFSESEVFFTETNDIRSRYPELKNYITKGEYLRADKFYFDEDRETYITCHALLRLILSKKLNKKPLEISFINERNGKPGLFGNPIYFNITHTREAFAIVISRYHYVGIDLENSKRSFDFSSVLETFFSKREREFILESPDDTNDRFFLLWTRKEALLKALGTGILADLKQVVVYKGENVPKMKSIDNLILSVESEKHFIHSEKLSYYYLSVATPQKVRITLNQLNEKNIHSYLD